MTTQIELPNYHPVFWNAVYARASDETKTVMTPEGEKDITFRTFLILGKYTQPSEDDVVKHLRDTTAKITCGLQVPEGYEPTDCSPLEKIMRKTLPDEVLNDITTGNPNCLKYIRQNTPAPQHKEGERKQYICVRAGMFPVKIIEENAKAGAIENSEWYNTAFQFPKFIEAGFGEQWKLTIKLYDDKLPSLNLVYKPETEQAKAVRITTHKATQFADIHNTLNTLYYALDTPTKIETIQDITEQVLTENSIPPVQALNQMAAEQQAKTFAAMMQMQQLKIMSGQKPN